MPLQALPQFQAPVAPDIHPPEIPDFGAILSRNRLNRLSVEHQNAINAMLAQSLKEAKQKQENEATMNAIALSQQPGVLSTEVSPEGVLTPATTAEGAVAEGSPEALKATPIITLPNGQTFDPVAARRQTLADIALKNQQAKEIAQIQAGSRGLTIVTNPETGQPLLYNKRTNETSEIPKPGGTAMNPLPLSSPEAIPTSTEIPSKVEPSTLQGNVNKNVKVSHLVDPETGDTHEIWRHANGQIEDRGIVKKQFAVGTELDPDTVDRLAKIYIAGGGLPPARGPAGQKNQTDVLKAATQIAKDAGSSPEDQLLKQSVYKANTQELNKLQTQRGPMMVAEQTANQNLDIAQQLSDKVDRTGVPVINRWLLANKQAVLGDPDVAAFHAAIQTAINETAKVTSGATGGSMTSDAARKEVEAMLNAAQSPEQIKSVIAVLRRDMHSRQVAYDNQIQTTKDSISQLIPKKSEGQSAMINVIAPDGTTGKIPAANLQKALSKGYKQAQ